MPISTEGAVAEIDAVLGRFGFQPNDYPPSDSLSKNADSRMAAAVSAFLACIERLGQGTPYVRLAANDVTDYGTSNPYTLSLLVGHLNGLRSDLEAGFIRTLVERVHDDVFADFLEMAEFLLTIHKRPSAVVAGTVLEEHLRKLSQKNAIQTSRGGRAVKADTLNGELGNTVYNKTRKDLRRLMERLEERWPRLDAEELDRRRSRFRERGTGYARLRSTAIRLQLEAVIALALDCGLRRHEISALVIDDAHYDNAYVVVWKGERWASEFRMVPFTDRSGAAMRDWIEFRSCLAPDHDALWLNLWAEPTNREPLKRDTLSKLLATYIGAGWTLSRLRATCAVRWVKAGLRPSDLQAYLGLASIADVLPYYAAAGQDRERRVARIGRGFDATRA